MANESRFTGSTGTMIIDYENEKIINQKNNTGSSQYKEFVFPFEDITGIEIQQPINKLLKKSFGGVHFIIQGKRLITVKPSASNNSLFLDATDIYIPDVNEFNRLSQEITTFASQRNIRIGTKGSNDVGYVFVDDYMNSGSTEIRMQCNVCGNIFCYSKQDLLKNRVLQAKAKAAHSGGVAQSLFTSQITGNQLIAEAQQYESQIVDYSKCPKCGSTNLKELSKEEFEQLNAQKNSSGNNTVSSTSVADELKKFKELLDLGAITQEEFDAKKKQLLGL